MPPRKKKVIEPIEESDSDLEIEQEPEPEPVPIKVKKEKKAKVTKVPVPTNEVEKPTKVRKVSKWIEHVKAYSVKHGCTYREAMTQAKDSYSRE